jgi:hypothetical protein
MNTYNKRRSLTHIYNEFPQFDVEPGFTEEDVLWTEQRETREHLHVRLKGALDQLFWVDGTSEFFDTLVCAGGPDVFLILLSQLSVSRHMLEPSVACFTRRGII